MAGVPSFAVGALPPQHLALRPQVPLCCLPQQRYQQISASAQLHSSSGCALQQAAPASAASGPHWTSLLRHTSCTVVGMVCAAAIRPPASATQILGREDTLPGCSQQGLRTLHGALATACSNSRGRAEFLKNTFYSIARCNLEIECPAQTGYVQSCHLL